VFIGKEKLKKVSDGVFQESAPPKDGSRPLEWRRSFNPIILPLKNLSINTTCSIHEVEFEWGDEKSPYPLKLVKPKISQITSIYAYVDEDVFRDRIYFTEKDEEDETLFSAERPKGDMRVILKPGKPSEESERSSSGIYHGHAFRMNYDPGEDEAYFDLTMPESEFWLLLLSVKYDSEPKLEVCVNLLSFTYEVDDFLAEHYHSRDIIIDGSAHCFILWVSNSQKVGQHVYVKPEEYEEEHGCEESDRSEYISHESLRHAELMQMLSACLKPLNGIITALWVLITVIVLCAFLA
jgi:hypothetical protein